MSLTYTWKLKSLKKKPIGNFKDVVIQTYWECTGTNEVGISGTFNGATPFTPTDLNEDGFISYDELTEEIILGWVQSQVVGGYKEHVDNVILKQIDDQINIEEEVREENLPWNNQ